MKCEVLIDGVWLNRILGDMRTVASIRNLRSAVLPFGNELTLTEMRLYTPKAMPVHNMPEDSDEWPWFTWVIGNVRAHMAFGLEERIGKVDKIVFIGNPRLYAWQLRRLNKNGTKVVVYGDIGECCWIVHCNTTFVDIQTIRELIADREQTKFWYSPETIDEAAVRASISRIVKDLPRSMRVKAGSLQEEVTNLAY